MMRQKLVTRRSYVYCEAPDELFVEDPGMVPQQLMEIVVAQRGLPCDGSGVPGIWCVLRHCHWATEDALYDLEAE